MDSRQGRGLPVVYRKRVIGFCPYPMARDLELHSLASANGTEGDCRERESEETLERIYGDSKETLKRLWKTHRETKGPMGTLGGAEGTPWTTDYTQGSLEGIERIDRERPRRPGANKRLVKEGRTLNRSATRETARHSTGADVREKWFLCWTETGRGREELELELERKTRKESRRLFSMIADECQGQGFLVHPGSSGWVCRVSPSLQ